MEPDGEGATKPKRSTKVVTEVLYKFLVIGNFGVGKTAIIRRFTEGKFSPYYKLTIGVDFASKTIQWSDDVNVSLQLWDIAGHERFGYMTRVYYKYAIAAIIVFDLSRPATFDSVIKWHSDVREKVSLQDGGPIPIMILANKCDLPDVSINKDVLNRFCRRHNILGWFYTSAKEDIHINEAMRFLVEHIMKNDSRNEISRPHVSLTEKHNGQCAASKDGYNQHCGC